MAAVGVGGFAPVVAAVTSVLHRLCDARRDVGIWWAGGVLWTGHSVPRLTAGEKLFWR